MKFTINKTIFEKFSSVRLGIVVALGVDNKKSAAILNFLRQEEKTVREKLSSIVISEHEFIAPWREAYRNFGSKPNEYSSSIEALAKRVQKGKELPDINPLVNLYNALSLKYLLPFGGEDLDKVKGNIRLGFANGTERGKYIGSNKDDACYPGEVAYLDELGFICRRWNWREADRTKLTSETKNVVLVAEALQPVSDVHLKQATEELSSKLKENLGGKTSIFYLDQQNPTLEIDFVTGTKLTETEGNASLNKIVSKEKNINLKQQKKLSIDKNKLPEFYSGLAKTIHDQLKNTLKKLGFPETRASLEHPAVEAHGDYSTNIALSLFSNPSLSSHPSFPSPRALADKIVAVLSSNKELKKVVGKIDVAGPGFINFHLEPSVFINELINVTEDKNEYGKSRTLLKKKVVVEYTDPNPFKELHIGHLYSNVIGESIAKLLEANGATVWRADFYGDVGVHTAKAVWGMKHKLKTEKVTLEDLAKKNISEKQAFLGQAYAYGAVQYSENKQATEEINHLNTLIYVIAQDLLKEEKNWKPIVDYKKFMNAPEFDYEEIKQLYKNGLKWSLEYFETLYKMLGTRFDGYYPESLVGEYGHQLVMEGLEKGVFERSEGAVIFRGVHTRVFINKNNLPTYETKDIGLALAKYNDFPYDLDINVTGAEIKEYFKVVIPALTAVRPDLGKVTTALSTGMVNLPEGKMSSRSGNVITVEGLFDKAAEYAIKLFKNKENHLPEGEKKRVAREVGMAAIRYAFLKSAIGNNIAFSFKDSVTFDGNSGPYLQYTYARTRSVLAKARSTWHVERRNSDELSATSYLPNAEEHSILRFIYRFPEVVMEAAAQYAPNLICTFLYELAQRFNTFYNKHRILNPSLFLTDPIFSQKKSQVRQNPALSTPRRVDGDHGSGEDSAGATSLIFRLSLTSAVSQVLKNGLTLLGIQAPTAM